MMAIISDRSVGELRPYRLDKMEEGRMGELNKDINE